MFAEETTANKNFCWNGLVLRNNSYAQSFHQQNLSKVKVCSRNTANKNFCWHGTVLGNYSYSQSFH